MNDELQTPNPFLPIVLLALSVLFALIWQLTAIKNQRNELQNAITRLQEPAKQSQQVQGSLQKLVTELLELSKTDSQAKAIVDKYGIRQNDPTAPR